MRDHIYQWGHGKALCGVRMGPERAAVVVESDCLRCLAIATGSLEANGDARAQATFEQWLAVREERMPRGSRSW